jgi:hypothetical protein
LYTKEWPAFAKLIRITAAFGTTFRVIGGYQKAGASLLEKVTGRIFKIKQPGMHVLHKKTAKIAKTISTQTKSAV